MPPSLRYVASLLAGAIVAAAVPISTPLLPTFGRWLDGALVLYLVGVAGWTGARYIAILRRRGVIRECSTNGRDADYESVYRRARRTVLVWGVAMQRVSFEREVFEEAAARGLNINVEMIDPEWLRTEPAVREVMQRYYAIPDIVELGRRSLARLSRTAEKINSSDAFRGRMRIYLVSEVYFNSGTVADPDGYHARGVVEHHAPSQPTRNAERRLVRDYRPPPWAPLMTDTKSRLRAMLESRATFTRRLYTNRDTPVV